MPGLGFEPRWPEGQGILSPLRLPVPPPRRGVDYIVRAPGARPIIARRTFSCPAGEAIPDLAECKPALGGSLSLPGVRRGGGRQAGV